MAFTLAVPASIALAQIALVPNMVEASGLGADPSDAATAATSFRWTIVAFHLGVGLLLLGYWLVMAIFCRGDMLRVRSANMCLALAALIFVTSMVLSLQSYRLGSPLEQLCPALGISSLDAPWGFDTASSCGRFANAWSVPIFLGLPLALLLASALLRIFISRHRFTRIQRATPGSQNI